MLGPEGFGWIASAWLLILLIAALHQAVIIQPMLSIGGKFSGPDLRAYLLKLDSVHLWGILPVLFTAGIIGWLLGRPINAGVAGLIFPGSAWAAGQMMQDFVRKKMAMEARWQQMPLLDALVLILQFSVLVWAYFAGWLTLTTAFWIIAGSLNAGWMAAIALGRMELKLPDRVAFSDIGRIHFSFGKWLAGTAVLQWFATQYLQLATVAFIGPVATGAVRIAQSLVGLCSLMVQAMEAIIPLEAARAWAQGGWGALKIFLSKQTLIWAIPISIALLTLSLSAPWLLGSLYGEAYRPFAWLVPGMAGVYALSYLAQSMRWALRTLETVKPILVSYAFSTFFSLSAAQWMLQYLGLPGLVWALLINQILLILVYVFVLIQINRRADHTYNAG